MGFDTPNQGDDVLESGDVDHQQTTNRTHSGDSLSPSSVSTDALTISGQKLIDTTLSFNGGQTVSINLDGSFGDGTAANFGDRLTVSVFPESDPGNDVGFVVDKRYYNQSSDVLRIDVTETENSDGGTARVTAWKVGV